MSTSFASLDEAAVSTALPSGTSRGVYAQRNTIRKRAAIGATAWEKNLKWAKVMGAFCMACSFRAIFSCTACSKPEPSHRVCRFSCLSARMKLSRLSGSIFCIFLKVIVLYRGWEVSTSAFSHSVHRLRLPGFFSGAVFCSFSRSFIPNRSLDFGEIARLCHAACFSSSRRRSGLRRGVARIRMRTEAGKMPESLTFPIRNELGVSNDRFGFIHGTKISKVFMNSLRSAQSKSPYGPLLLPS